MFIDLKIGGMEEHADNLFLANQASMIIRGSDKMDKTITGSVKFET